MTIYKPAITSVTMTPNPVTINNTFLVSIAATEIEVVLYKVTHIAGTIKAGQVINLNISKEVSA